jgi:DNA repair protein RadA/Sms
VKNRETYVCSACGSRTPLWQGQCPACREWNSLEAAQLNRLPGRSSAVSKGAAIRAVPLTEVGENGSEAFGTGLSALDRILGKGLVPGATLLVGGEPGIGKSTVLLQVAGAVSASGRSVVYLSGEESLAQLKGRAARLGVLRPDLQALATTRLEDAMSLFSSARPPHLLIVDSVQTVSSGQAEGLPGNVSQVRAVATELVEACKNSNTTLILVGHVTKDGALAGPRLLEHMVDTVISLEGDRRQMFRLLRVLKNRFGPTQELIVFQMAEQGMQVVEDPSTFFLGARDSSLSGTAVVMAVDGQRPFAVEVQALVSRSYLAIPRRTALGFDVNRLHLLLAVLEKRGRLNFGQVDIYAKIGGGMRLDDPGLDLGLVASVLSSFYDIALPERAVFWGEVDLNGQVRPVSLHHVRADQATRLGYSPILRPASEGGKRAATILDLQRQLSSKRVKSGEE